MKIQFILWVIALLSACGAPAPKVSEPVDQAAHVRRLLAEGRYQLALAEYDRLGKLYPDKADFYRLQATQTLISMQEWDQARAMLTIINPQDAAASVQKTLLQAELELQNNRPGRALKLLSRDEQDKVPDALRAQRLLLRARAYMQQAAYLPAAQAYIRRETYLSQPDARAANARHIWTALNKVDRHGLEQLERAAADARSGWPELALLGRTLLADPPGLQRALSDWQLRYPGHGANRTVIPRLLADSQRYQLQPGQIALLLPLSGDYRAAAGAIRDGFIAAWYAAKTTRPPLRIYDATSLNIRQRYRLAVAEGAEFIVGPLEKQALRQLYGFSGLNVPTLALNRLEHATELPDNNGDSMLPILMQFGLSPEDEASQVAERAFHNGHNNALIIIPADRWGQRLSAAFQKTWTNLGGLTLEKIEYQVDGTDYSLPVKRLLNIDDSEQRAKRLRRKLGRALESRSRLRQDADMIFMAAAPVAARQIVPQLRFHQAERLPVYATSHVFSGNENRQADLDMNGVTFTDMPWILNADETAASLQIMPDADFQVTESAYRRLYALGVDAYRLIPHLNRLAFEQDLGYAGVTGRLSMDRNGRIHRALLWGRIVDGRPTLIPATDKSKIRRLIIDR